MSSVDKISEKNSSLIIIHGVFVYPKKRIIKTKNEKKKTGKNNFLLQAVTTHSAIWKEKIR